MHIYLLDLNLSYPKREMGYNPGSTGVFGVGPELWLDLRNLFYFPREVAVEPIYKISYLISCNFLMAAALTSQFLVSYLDSIVIDGKKYGKRETWRRNSNKIDRMFFTWCPSKEIYSHTHPWWSRNVLLQVGHLVSSLSGKTVAVYLGS